MTTITWIIYLNLQKIKVNTYPWSVMNNCSRFYRKISSFIRNITLNPYIIVHGMYIHIQVYVYLFIENNFPSVSPSVRASPFLPTDTSSFTSSYLGYYSTYRVLRGVKWMRKAGWWTLKQMYCSTLSSLGVPIKWKRLLWEKKRLGPGLGPGGRGRGILNIKHA